ncbi:mitochondrial inner membrane protein OXA1, putative [Plasmodium vivax]|uniref:Mitochondrial inner membrane protein OXA1, putative n=2 Tax=Plasmodium vivax TaxID=5855 RepID=A0A1G4H8S6_PLAVI|nr:inner membrane protein oxa1-2 [Plasmodium vivax North Korean]SCO71216.1 mitochondrial inner membrane protein OXA1, putative [Plasmodium vivax]
MSFAHSQIKLHNGILKKSSQKKFFFCGNFFKRGKHDCAITYGHNRICEKEAKGVSGGTRGAYFVHVRNFIHLSSIVASCDGSNPKGYSQWDREDKSVASAPRDKEKTGGSEHTGEENLEWVKSDKNEETLGDSPPGEVTKDEIIPYTHFIIEKCKAKMQQDVDNYESSWYVELVYELLNCTKIMFDCSWMTSIVATTSFMRMIILPLTVSAERDRRKQKILNPLIKELTNKLKSNAQDGNIKMALEFKKKILNIRNTHGISLIPKSIIMMAFFQTPLFFIFYFSMKKMASYPEVFKEFTFESPLWLDSLSLPDPYYILPLLSSLLLLSNNELTALIDKALSNSKSSSLSGDDSEFQKKMKQVTKLAMRLFYISSLFFFKSMPSGLLIYLITNTVFQLLTTQICKIKVIERFLDLPPLYSRGLSFQGDAGGKNQSDSRRRKGIHMDDFVKGKFT